MSTSNLNRFIDAQENSYSTALSEIKNGKKRSHWMWYIFPQIAGLGKSETARYYSLNNIEEAKQFIDHPVLSARLIEISNALLSLENKTALEIFGSPDDVKLRSSMTLFSILPEANKIFMEVLEKYFPGNKDEKTLQILDQHY